jgi:hypothetical protein
MRNLNMKLMQRTQEITFGSGTYVSFTSVATPCSGDAAAMNKTLYDHLLDGWMVVERQRES